MVDVTAPRPSVTIVIPVKNGAPWLARTLASTKEQGVPFELIVVDDGSVDESVAIARAWPGARVMSAVGRGEPGARHSAAAARNTGLRAASTAWIQFLDADDRLAPGKLARQLAAASQGADIVFSEIRSVYDTLGDHSVPELRRHCSRRDWVTALGRINVLAVHAPIVRRQALLDLGGFPEDVGAERDSESAEASPVAASPLMGVDWVLWARAALRGCQFQFVPGLAGYYHHHAANASADRVALFRDELLALRELTRLYRETNVGARGRMALALGYERVARELWIRGEAEEARASLAESMRLIPSPLPGRVDSERDDHLRGLPACLELADVDAFWSRRGVRSVDPATFLDALATTPPFDIADCSALTIGVLRSFRVVSRADRGHLIVRVVPIETLRAAFRAAAAFASMKKFLHQGTMRYWRRPWHLLPELRTRAGLKRKTWP